jgi:hypothetical protein
MISIIQTHFKSLGIENGELLPRLHHRPMRTESETAYLLPRPITDGGMRGIDAAITHHPPSFAKCRLRRTNGRSSVGSTAGEWFIWFTEEESIHT